MECSLFLLLVTSFIKCHLLTSWWSSNGSQHNNSTLYLMLPFNPLSLPACFLLNALNALGVHFTKLCLNSLSSVYKHPLNPFCSGAQEQIGVLVHLVPSLVTSVTPKGSLLKTQNEKKAGGGGANKTRQTLSYIYLSLDFLFCPLGFFNVCLISQVIDFWRKRLPDKYMQFTAHWFI